MTSSLEFIHEEHRNIARVLRALEKLAGDDTVLKRSVATDLLTSMLYYLRVYPYAVHHPKEERHLFPAVTAKDATAAAAVDALHKEHAEGYALLQRIEIAAAEAGAEGGLARLKETILAYVGHEYRHMEREEKEILPVAERVLAPAAVSAMRRHFAAHADPVFGENIRAGFDALHQYIMAKV